MSRQTQNHWERGWPWSVQTQVAGLMIAAILTAQVVSLVVVVATPAPVAPRMTLGQAREALVDGEAARRSGLERRISVDPPVAATPPSLTMFAVALAQSLDVEADSIRLVAEAPTRLAPPADDRALVVVTSPDTSPQVFLEHAPTPSLDSATLRAVMDSNFSLPASAVAWRQADGLWLVVGPATPITADWRFRLFASFALSLAMVAPLGWIAARHMTRPIRQLADAARRTRLGAPATPPPGGPREIRDASLAMNEMAGRLAEEAEQRANMLVAIAHDLRTPLTSMRLRIEGIAHEDRAVIAQQIQRMEGMIGGVLEYAQARRPESPDVFDLRSLLDEAIALTGPEEGVKQVGEQENLPVFLPQSAVLRAVANLIGNARRYASAVEVEAVQCGTWVRVAVRDRGPGIAAADLDRVRKPFQRGESSRNLQTGGLGLGLSIVSDIAAACGGEFAIRNRPGGGVEATLSLPSSVPATYPVASRAGEAIVAS